MGDFFRGWQRRTGLVVLVMALGLICGWLRSNLYLDVVTFGGIPNRTHLFFSNHAAIGWASVPPRHASLVFYENHDVVTDIWEGTPVEWRWRWCGFDFGNGSLGPPSSKSVIAWSIPYWAITPAATLLAAYLLLKTPRMTRVNTAQRSE